LHFPSKKYCCKCCNAAAGCGIVTQNWFKDGTFKGKEKDGEYTLNKWDVKGLQSNIYEATDDADGRPARIYQVPVSDMKFDYKNQS
jgi:hypothetical protein